MVEFYNVLQYDLINFHQDELLEFKEYIKDK